LVNFDAEYLIFAAIMKLID